MEQLVTFSTFFFCIPYFICSETCDGDSADWSIFYIYLHWTVLFIHYSCSVLCLSLFICVLPYYLLLTFYLSLQIFLVCSDYLGLTVNCFHNLLRVGNYRLSYLGTTSWKHRSLHISIFMNVIEALQFLQSAFLRFWKCFSGGFLAVTLQVLQTILLFLTYLILFHNSFRIKHGFVVLSSVLFYLFFYTEKWGDVQDFSFWDPFLCVHFTFKTLICQCCGPCPCGSVVKETSVLIFFRHHRLTYIIHLRCGLSMGVFGF